MNKWLLILFIAITSLSAYAASPKKADSVRHKPYALVYDTIKPQLRSFDQGKLAEYRRQSAFQYIEKDYTHKNWWERFWDWFWDWLKRLLRRLSFNSPNGGEGLRYLIIGAAVILLLWVIIKYIGAGVFRFLGKGDDKVDVPYQETLENIHEINFDDDIEAALTQRNYKLAVRLLYLRSLKQLSDAGLIHWQIEKTNSVYVDEIANADQRQSFSILTRQFEYVWYGDFPVDERSFKNIDILFQDFKKIIA